MMRVFLILFCACTVWAGLDDIKAEPSPSRRSELALNNAEAAMTTAQEAYRSGDGPKTEQALAEVRDSIELSFSSLEQSHERPRSSKYYKHAELRLRALIRRLEGFRNQVSFEERERVEPLEKRIQEIHDQLIQEIMSKRK
jgi:hypothetical protein